MSKSNKQPLSEKLKNIPSYSEQVSKVAKQIEQLKETVKKAVNPKPEKK